MGSNGARSPEPSTDGQPLHPRPSCLTLVGVLISLAGCGTSNESAANETAGCDPEFAREPGSRQFSSFPVLSNPDELLGAVQNSYRQELEPLNLAGTVGILFLVNEAGRVEKVAIARSSESPILDSAATRVAMEARFVPAKNQDTPICFWVEAPIAFGPQNAARIPAQPPESAGAKGTH